MPDVAPPIARTAARLPDELAKAVADRRPTPTSTACPA
jgi:hypothetical protein